MSELNQNQVAWLEENVKAFKPWQGWPANVKSRGLLPYHQQLMRHYGPVAAMKMQPEGWLSRLYSKLKGL